MVGPLMTGRSRGLRHAFRALRHRDFALCWSGALVSSIGKLAGEYPIPVAIVPGHLSDEELDAMT